jgi:hypothetical protein
MKQPQYSPLTNAEIVCVIFAGTNGLPRQATVSDVGRFEQGLVTFLRQQEIGLAGLDHQRGPQDQGRRRRQDEGRDRRIRRRLRLIRNDLRRVRRMPSLKDLKNRIESVKSTRKITKAMQMVAAAKLRRAQERRRWRAPMPRRWRP